MLKFEAGKFYKNRRGTKVGPLLATKNSEFPWRIAGLKGGTFYLPDGRLYPGKNSVSDLVAEWSDPVEEGTTMEDLKTADACLDVAKTTTADKLSAGVDVQRESEYTSQFSAEDKTTGVGLQVKMAPSKKVTKVSALEFAGRQSVPALPDTQTQEDEEKANAERLARRDAMRGKKKDADPAKPRSRTKPAPDKVKQAEKYAQIKKELAEISEKTAPKRKVKPAINTDTDGYAPLVSVLNDALKQASEGKGKELHANSKPFDRQPIAEIGRMVGVGYNLGQAMKKAQEAKGMADRGEPDRAVAELLGVINYAASAVMLLRE